MRCVQVQQWKKEKKATAVAQAEAQEQIDALLLELQGRPSAIEWRQAQSQLKDLEFQLEAAIEVATAAGKTRKMVFVRAGQLAAEAGAREKYEDTRTLMKRDKAMHRLQLHRLQALSLDAATRVMQEFVCGIGHH